MSKFLKWVMIPLLGGIALAIIGHVTHFYHMEQTLLRQIALLRQNGVIVAYDQLVPSVPDDTNAAIPLRKLVLTIRNSPTFIPQLQPSLIKYPFTNNTLPIAITRKDPTPTPSQLDAIKIWIKDNQHVFNEMKSILDKTNYREYSSSPPILLGGRGTPIILWDLHKLYAASIYISIQNQNYAKSIQLVTDFLKLISLSQQSCASNNEYEMIRYYTKFFTDYLDIIISKFEPSELQLRELINILSTVDLFKSAKNGLVGTLLFESKIVEDLCDQPLLATSFSYDFVIGFGKGLPRYYDEGVFADADQYVILADTPYYLSKDTMEKLTTRINESSILNHTKAFIDLYNRNQSEIARLDMICLKLSIILHLIRHNFLPASLKDVDHAILRTMPVDPYTGNPYTYATHGSDSFSITSSSYEHAVPAQDRIAKDYKRPLPLSTPKTPEQ